ncbi:MAG: LysR family transcriptional regulator [Rhodospirillaceae bacterium]|nr:LysR family transcriptional regulator [Magnetovibrio sp.]MAY66830.1 LysR family transcriptional regulator [Rhodospirillaceae bacterium]
MNFTLRQLQVLTAVARHGSFTRAAQDLGMTQSAVSTSVRHLEAELGLPLFDRDTRNVRPTETGRDLAGRVGGLLDDLNNVLENARSTALRRRGRVRIAAVPTAITRLLPPCCAECRGRYPEIDLRIEEMAAEDVAAAVLDGRADLGVLNEGRDIAALAATPLGNDIFCLVCPQGHPLARKRAPKWRDLEGADMVMLDARTGSRALIDGVLQDQGVSVRPVQEMSRPEAVCALVAAGMGIAVLPELAAPTAADQTLVTRRLSEPEAFRRMVLVHAPGRPPEGPAALVAELLSRRGA